MLPLEQGRPVAAIVDPYSSGSLFAPELERRGYACVMVQSSEEIPVNYRSSFRPEDFTSIIQYAGDIKQTVTQLRECGVQLLLAGCEVGVELADELSENLGLLSNGTKRSKARRDKFLMAQVVAEHGLHTAKHFRSDSAQEIVDWISSHTTWPVIVKPLQSAGSDQVSLCLSESEVVQAVHKIMNHKNQLGLINESVLVQEFLAGTEYVVDTVSYAGKHKALSFWKYAKPASDPTFVGYDSIELLPYQGDIQSKLFAYVQDVLDALEISYGPCHCEVMLVGQTPMLVEIGARMIGGHLPTIARACTGISQVESTLDAYLSPDCFLEQLGRPYQMSTHGTLVFIIPKRMGRLKAMPRLDEISALRSYHEMRVGVKVGQPLSRIVGWVTLLHEDKSVIESDLRQIRDLEENGLFSIESA